MRRVIVTGAAGNLGGKLCDHFRALGWDVLPMDRIDAGDSRIYVADLSIWRRAWAEEFRNVDSVVHLAGDPNPAASWRSVQELNFDLTANVFEASVAGGIDRVILASSNWVLAGYRFEQLRLTPDTDPRPINAYGASKLFCERLGRSFSRMHNLSVICLRIGYCQSGENLPSAEMGWGIWGQEMWLSNRDLCQGFEKAVTVSNATRFSILNLMSDNNSMRWDLQETKRILDFSPLDSYTPEKTKDNLRQEQLARDAYTTMIKLSRFYQTPFPD